MIRTTTLGNKATTAIDFELSLSYDHDLSNIYYNDWIDQMNGYHAFFSGSYGRSSHNDYLVIGCIDAPYFKKSHLARKKKAELVELAYAILDYSYAECETKATLIDELMNVTVGDYFKYYRRETNYHDLDCDFVVRGHCQGDVVKVKIIHNAKGVGIEYINKEMLENLFYNTPVSGCIEFMSNQIHLDEYMDDIYNYDREKLLENFKNNYDGVYKERLVEFLDEELPIYLP